MKKIAFFLFALLCNLAHAQEETLTARKIDSDYTESKFWVSSLTCSENSVLLEKVPDIIAVDFTDQRSTCYISFIHKKSYKLLGKSFHVVTRHPSGFTSADKFIIEKK